MPRVSRQPYRQNKAQPNAQRALPPVSRSSSSASNAGAAHWSIPCSSIATTVISAFVSSAGLIHAARAPCGASGSAALVGAGAGAPSPSSIMELAADFCRRSLPNLFALPIADMRARLDVRVPSHSCSTASSFTVSVSATPATSRIALSSGSCSSVITCLSASSRRSSSSSVRERSPSTLIASCSGESKIECSFSP